ncbi:MAG TPA: GDSL-type esterase/lipase family protein [Caulobacteraceae bacterium]|jgi:acyl-CoA thioesterase-1|nr:GDSL-type esterase/lipase family protein [Caulobacteraceae bacterium]
MPLAPDRFFIRRALLASLAASVAAPAFASPAPVVTILGDSITAGLGLPAAAALPAQLALALARLGMSVTVRGAGVSGDTSADGLARLDFSVQADTAVCLVALGGNDLLQGVDPKVVRASLDAIVRRLKARRIGVVLAGQTAPPAVGAGYARDFAAVFPSIAQAEHVPLYPDLLAGVGRSLRQGDGLHPNPAGVKVIAAGLAPLVAKALKARR